MLGHARGVSELAGTAGSAVGLDDAEVGTASPCRRRARTGTPRRVQRHLGQAGSPRHRRVGAGADASLSHRAHAAVSPRPWRPSGPSPCMLRERLDGSGYPRRLSGVAIPLSARVLGAADAYQAMGEPRPYREALSPEQAAVSSCATRSGRAGWTETRSTRCSAPPATASRAAARARPDSRLAKSTCCARCLVVCPARRSRFVSSSRPRLARNHIEHIYAKIGVSTRAAASLFALQHGLLPDEELALE